MNLGIYSDLSNEDYHGSEGVSRSTLWEMFNRTPAHAHGSVHEATDALSFGHALHVCVLEPQRFGLTFGRLPDGHNGTTKAGKEAKASIEAMGLSPLKADQYDAIIAIKNAVWSEPLVAKALTGAQVEHSGYWKDETTGMLCKCRPDAYSKQLRIMADLKTAEDASIAGFSMSMAKYGYHMQQAFYRDGWTLAGGGAVDAFIFIVVEKKPPYAYSIFELTPEDEELGRAIYRNTLVRYAQCQTTNIWPGYPSGVQSISLPAWARSRMEAALV